MLKTETQNITNLKVAIGGNFPANQVACSCLKYDMPLLLCNGMFLNAICHNSYINTKFAINVRSGSVD